MSNLTSTPEQPVRKRRRLQFSLGMLLAAMTAICCWLGWEVNVVRERKAMLNEYRTRYYVSATTASQYASRVPPSATPLKLATVSTLRSMLGDEPIQQFSYARSTLPKGADERLRKWFPEAKFDTYERPLEPCHPGCFPAGTLVVTENGERRIETIQVGDRLVAFDREGARKLVPVTSIFRTSNRLVAIKTAQGELLTTPTQPLALSFTRQVAASELVAGDELLVWRDDQPHPTKILDARKTDRVARVFNLVLEDSELFIAGGHLARSKPPAPAGQFTGHEVAEANVGVGEGAGSAVPAGAVTDVDTGAYVDTVGGR
ncbi:MAG TPA: Hint domain-containing protein [Pirellulaceae bacterium]|nr:Hint domain-containing protein [Pirellulaceae bacterium]